MASLTNPRLRSADPVGTLVTGEGMGSSAVVLIKPWSILFERSL